MQNLFELTVDALKAHLGEGWQKSAYRNKEIRFSKKGQAIAFVVRNTTDAKLLKAVCCTAQKKDPKAARAKSKAGRAKRIAMLPMQLKLIGKPCTAVPLRVFFNGYEENPVYHNDENSGEDAVRAFIGSVLAD